MDNVSWASINGFDIMIALIMCLSSLLAFNKGFISSVLSLIGWVLSVLFTYNLFPYLEPLLKKHMSSFMVLVFGYFGTLIVFLFFFAILNFTIATTLGSLRKSTFDRFLGIIFGTVRGMIVVLVLFLCLSSILNILNGKKQSEEELPEFIVDSYSYPLLITGQQELLEVLPESLRNLLVGKQDNNKVNNKSVINHQLLKLTIAKLSDYADNETLNNIGNKVRQSVNDKNEEEMALDTLQILLNNYKSQYMNGKISSSKALSKEDLNEAEQLLKKENSDSNSNNELY